MLPFMRWSLAAMGCLIVLGSLAGRWWERTMVSKGQSPGQVMRFFWPPLLMGLVLIGGQVPGLLHAPYPVVELADALSFALAIMAAITLLFALRSGVASSGGAAQCDSHDGGCPPGSS
ncbi:hypothetical protein [Streptomyces carpinensis]|uniref:Uncharacterized protein n=1 Tax=Streptomyces carpinensis TaxID=66369 RepID=A0ABV1VVY9_9ACTN|nr:hypothetical protein [Streptomyces carpinensis]